MAVCAVGEFESQNLSVFFGLLQSVAWVLVIWFGFDDRDKKVSCVTKQIIGALAGLAKDSVSDRDYAPVGESSLFCEGMRLVVPSGGDKLRGYVLSASIGLVAHRIG